MNDAGRSVGPARGAFKVRLDRVLVIHDEIDLPFGEIRTRVGGGPRGPQRAEVASGRRLGSPDFARVRVGVGRPPTTDPDRVAAYVLGRFREPREEVELLIEQAADAAERARLETTGRPRLRRGCFAPSSPMQTTIRRPPRSPSEGGRAFVSQSLRPYLIAALLDRDPDTPAIVVAGDDRAARDLAAGLRAWLDPRPVRYYPSRGVTYESHLAPPPHLVGLRIAALDALVEIKRGAPPRWSWSAPSRCPRRSPTRRFGRTGSCCAPASCSTSTRRARDLVAAGYERVDQVEDRGQFAIRGGLLDLFAATEDRAVRVDLFGDEIESLRWFSTFTQRSLGRRRAGRGRAGGRARRGAPRARRDRGARGRRPSGPTSPSCCRSRTSTRSWSWRRADATILIAGEEDVAPALADHWQDVTRRLPRPGRAPPVRRRRRRSQRRCASARASGCRASTRTSRSSSAPRRPTSRRAGSRRPSPSSRSSRARATARSWRSRAAARASGCVQPRTADGAVARTRRTAPARRRRRAITFAEARSSRASSPPSSTSR